MKPRMSNLMHFQGEIVHYFPPKRGAEKRKLTMYQMNNNNKDSFMRYE